MGNQTHWKEKFRTEYTEIPNPLAHKVLDISLTAITDETENYAQALSTKTLLALSLSLSFFLSLSLTHTHATYTNISKSRETHIPALWNRKVSPVTNYDTNSLWERIRAWPLLCPNSNQAVNEAEKNGLNLVIERLFRNVNSNTCTSGTLYYITGYNKTAKMQRKYPLHILRLCISCACWYEVEHPHHTPTCMKY